MISLKKPASYKLEPSLLIIYEPREFLGPEFYFSDNNFWKVKLLLVRYESNSPALVPFTYTL